MEFTIPDHMKNHAQKLNIRDKLTDEQIEHLMLLIFGSMALSMLDKGGWMMTPTAFMEAIGLNEKQQEKIHKTLTSDALSLMLGGD